MGGGGGGRYPPLFTLENSDIREPFDSNTLGKIHTFQRYVWKQYNYLKDIMFPGIYRNVRICKNFKEKKIVYWESLKVRFLKWQQKWHNHVSFNKANNAPKCICTHTTWFICTKQPYYCRSESTASWSKRRENNAFFHLTSSNWESID